MKRGAGAQDLALRSPLSGSAAQVAAGTRRAGGSPEISGQQNERAPAASPDYFLMMSHGLKGLKCRGASKQRCRC